jgi:sigma-B regulation protein RsbU (phosphoserine phosphatase)
VVELQDELAQRISDLEASLARKKTLQGLLPICSYCKKVRNDGNYWEQVEFYIEKHADVSFSHGICPTCFKDVVEPELAEFEAKVDKGEEGPL